jgi:hypothetical protein
LTNLAVASTVVVCFAGATVRGAPAINLWAHITNESRLGEQRGVVASFRGPTLQRVMQINVREANRKAYIWVTVPGPESGWNLSGSRSVEAEITNRGTNPQTVMLWAVGRHGWDAVGDSATLKPGESRVYFCDLRDAFPDGTLKVDPHDLKEVRVIARGGDVGSVIEVSGLKAVGDAPGWRAPADRLTVPEMQVRGPGAGRRIRYQLEGDEGSGIYCVLYLPKDWSPHKKYPVIAEFPGNIYFANATFSTGRPEQCVLGYGMTKGEGAIWVSLPFVDRRAGTIIEDGWGDADQTADYAVSAVEEICRRFGGDRRNVVLAGFSRGAIAGGYIGLRNERVAALWKGMALCQHYDGDGWNGATLDGALARAHRFSGLAIFQTDNSNEKLRDGNPKLQQIMKATGARVTYALSHLGAHACAMFLDERPSAQELRRWFQNLVHE